MLFWFCLQVYSGQYQRPEAVAAQVNLVETPPEALKVDSFIGVHIKDYNKTPVIERVTLINDNFTFDLVYWKGSWREKLIL